MPALVTNFENLSHAELITEFLQTLYKLLPDDNFNIAQLKGALISQLTNEPISLAITSHIHTEIGVDALLTELGETVTTNNPTEISQPLNESQQLALENRLQLLYQALLSPQQVSAENDSSMTNTVTTSANPSAHKSIDAAMKKQLVNLMRAIIRALPNHTKEFRYVLKKIINTPEQFFRVLEISIGQAEKIQLRKQIDPYHWNLVINYIQNLNQQKQTIVKAAPVKPLKQIKPSANPKRPTRHASLRTSQTVGPMYDKLHDLQAVLAEINLHLQHIATSTASVTTADYLNNCVKNETLAQLSKLHNDMQELEKDPNKTSVLATGLTTIKIELEQTQEKLTQSIPQIQQLLLSKLQHQYNEASAYILELDTKLATLELDSSLFVHDTTIDTKQIQANYKEQRNILQAMLGKLDELRDAIENQKNNIASTIQQYNANELENYLAQLNKKLVQHIQERTAQRTAIASRLTTDIAAVSKAKKQTAENSSSSPEHAPTTSSSSSEKILPVNPIISDKYNESLPPAIHDHEDVLDHIPLDDDRSSQTISAANTLNPSAFNLHQHSNHYAPETDSTHVFEHHHTMAATITLSTTPIANHSLDVAKKLTSDYEITNISDSHSDLQTEQHVVLNQLLEKYKEYASNDLSNQTNAVLLNTLNKNGTFSVKPVHDTSTAYNSTTIPTTTTPLMYQKTFAEQGYILSSSIPRTTPIMQTTQLLKQKAIDLLIGQSKLNKIEPIIYISSNSERLAELALIQYLALTMHVLSSLSPAHKDKAAPELLDIVRQNQQFDIQINGEPVNMLQMHMTRIYHATTTEFHLLDQPQITTATGFGMHEE